MMLDGKVALVTGATGGLGPVVAQKLAESGASVVAVARDAEALARLAETLPAQRCLTLPVDLTDAAATEGAVAQAVARLGRVDILVAAAGGWRGGTPVAETSPETLAWNWTTNVVTAFNACRAVLPVMTQNGWGRIITVAARSAQGGQARSGAYAAGKAAVLALTQSLAAEVRSRGVTANTLLISTIDTPANRDSMPNADRSRWVSPAQVAGTILFLCGEEAAAITGAAIPL